MEFIIPTFIEGSTCFGQKNFSYSDLTTAGHHMCM